MNDPAVHVLPLEQGERSPEDHTTDFSLAAYIEWVLVSCRSSLTVDIVDDDISTTHDPVPSPPSPRSAAHQLEPTVDREPEPIMTDEPSPKNATELRIATEPEHKTSDQVLEPATELAMGENDKGSSAHHNITEFGTGTNGPDFFADIYADMPPQIPPSSELSVDPEPFVCPDLSACLDFPPNLPLLPHPFIPASATPPLSPEVGSLQVCQFPSASWLEDPSSPSPASDGSAPAPSSPPSPVGPPAPPGSLVPPAPPWSVVDPPLPQDSTPQATPRRSVPPAPLGSSLPPAPLGTSGSPPRSPEPWTPPRPSGSSVSPGLVGSPSPPRAPPPLAPPPSVSPLESSALPLPWLLPPSAVGRHLSFTWLLLLRVPSVSSLAPPSVVTTMDFVCCPPPENASSTRACTDLLLPSHVHSFVHLLSPLCSSLFCFCLCREVVPSGRAEGGRTVTLLNYLYWSL
ncbi:Accumulation-associated protein [Labeo rohita]|uniref:Accumulation-associated protein n=1 Tax=Labeo rohita TaxID=84645 RepID=A0ABQ8LT69_LABRO|nr:Accumulation-associated protein [Labeo rohita]